MSTAHRSPEGTTFLTLPLFLVTLPRTTKFQDLFKLSNLCHISIKVESYKSLNALTSATTARRLATSGLIANNLPNACDVGGGHLHKDCPERGAQLQRQHAATASWLKERQHIPPTTEAAGMLKKKCRREISREHRKTQRGILTQISKNNLSFATAARGRMDPKTYQKTATSSRVPK
jgi:hypothetical protein